MKAYCTLLLCLLLLVGCRKKEEAFSSYLRFTMDGKTIECSRNIEASGNYIRGTNLNTQVITISGDWTTSVQEAGSIALELFNYNNTTGEWQLESPGGATLWLEFLNGSLLTGGTYSARGADTKLIIEQVDDRYIKGRFSFDASMITGPGTAVKKTVTNGAFHIKRNP
ncbi:MAG TPA: hypothetical protein VGN63_14065 [Flavisolibacter sp.]|jgi:hypothetical protein|nr:hypothetical protein [Flavisolibacter sp.]